MQTMPETYPAEHEDRMGSIGARAKGHGEENVFEAGVALKKVKRLKDVPDRSAAKVVAGGFLERGHILFAEQDRTAVGGQDSRYKVEERRLSGSAFPTQ